jgi:hypothetical protein
MTYYITLYIIGAILTYGFHIGLYVESFPWRVDYRSQDLRTLFKYDFCKWWGIVTSIRRWCVWNSAGMSLIWPISIFLALFDIAKNAPQTRWTLHLPQKPDRLKFEIAIKVPNDASWYE